MPRIFDNIELHLHEHLRQTLAQSHRGDFCVGYFNLRGWRLIDDVVDQSFLGGTGKQARLLVGMQVLPREELRTYLQLNTPWANLDNRTAVELKRRVAEEFKEQLVRGFPTNADEAGLRRLRAQLSDGKVRVKVFVGSPLHAKLYLFFRDDANNPITGFVGSSNLTLAGLQKQGELNVDVLEHDACEKLARWFEDRWDDRWTMDITNELIDILDQSWAREALVPPYHVYLKIAYHLSREARAGLSEFQIPRDLRDELLEFQAAAVKIAAHHLNKRGGVVIGDVVGLGKTMMAVTLARIFEDDFASDALIVCPANLVKMWEKYVDDFRLRAKVVSLGAVITTLPTLRRYRLLILDESHNLRNREGARYAAIRQYIEQNDCRCVLLTATPYNKSYLDLSAQLRLFVPEHADLGIRPEHLLREIGETEFIRRHQAPMRSLAAFEHSSHFDDWRELMRLFLVRRTRSFIEQNYGTYDPVVDRTYLTFPDGTQYFFPKRKPKTVPFVVDDQDPADQYAPLFADDTVRTIGRLKLPRYGLANYLAPGGAALTPAERETIQRLSRGGTRLMGFCRTNLFKRLESGGPAFLLSIQRHALRNYVLLHALEHGLDVPIGPQDVASLVGSEFDEDVEVEDPQDGQPRLIDDLSLQTEAEYRARAAGIYGRYAGELRARFRWLKSDLFHDSLRRDLDRDADDLRKMLNRFGKWDPDSDAKLIALLDLLTEKHPDEKVLVFTQFADTARYLVRQIGTPHEGRAHVSAIDSATGDSGDPTAVAWRFSPRSNRRHDLAGTAEELRVVVATDVLSEGQNLQDAAIIVNYDLPWAIIRLIQRAGRVDRIGQQSHTILCYSFLPADGVERILRLRQRVQQRLEENAEVLGTDESFFEDEAAGQALVDLYHENATVLEGDADQEVDLSSYALQIWKNATDDDPALALAIQDMPPVVYSTRRHNPGHEGPPGVLVYVRTSAGADALVWCDENGERVTESQFAVLRAAECGPDELPQPRASYHHEVVAAAYRSAASEDQMVGGQLGRPSGARFRAYERLVRYAEDVRGTLMESDSLLGAIDDIYRYPLRQGAVDTLNRQMRAGISDEQLANLILSLREDEMLSLIEDQMDEVAESEIICSMGLAAFPE